MTTELEILMCALEISINNIQEADGQETCKMFNEGIEECEAIIGILKEKRAAKLIGMVGDEKKRDN